MSEEIKVFTEKDIKKWVENAVDKGYEVEDVEDLLSDSKLNEDIKKELIEAFKEKHSKSERLKLSFMQRMSLKKALKKIRKFNKEMTKSMDTINKKAKALNKKEKKALEDLKQQMIDAILGNEEKKKSGLNELFDVTDEKGEEITRKMLNESSVVEVQELLDDLIKLLENEV